MPKTEVAMELLGPVPEIVLWYLLTMVFDAVLLPGRLGRGAGFLTVLIPTLRFLI